MDHVAATGPVGGHRLLLRADVAWLAASELPVAAAVGYYGGQITQFLDRSPKCPVMLHFGALDSMIPLDEVAKIGEQYPEVEIHVYDEADHGFNCDVRASHHPESAALALERTLAFLAARSSSASATGAGCVIIDCHGHYTTAPPQLGEYRDAQQALLATDPDARRREGLDLDQRRRDPRQPRGRRSCKSAARARHRPHAVLAAGELDGHHIGNAHTSRFWSEHCNELIRRVCDLYPANFAPVCQLPQSPGRADRLVGARAAPLRRRDGVHRLQPQPRPVAVGMWNGPPLDDRSFWPLYEAMCELDVPAMIHVSATCNPHFHTTGSHYLGADTTAFMQVLTSGHVHATSPTMRLIIPHGGGAVPVPLGSLPGHRPGQRGWQTLDELMTNVWFDTCVYHQPGIDLLVDVVPIDNILFASEMVGAVRGIDPQTGHFYDDTRRYIDGADLSDADREKIFEGNVRRVFPRLRTDAAGGVQ